MRVNERAYGSKISVVSTAVTFLRQYHVYCSTKEILMPIINQCLEGLVVCRVFYRSVVFSLDDKRYINTYYVITSLRVHCIFYLYYELSFVRFGSQSSRLL